MKKYMVALLIALAGPVHAAGILSTTTVGEGTRYYREDSQGTSASVLTFPGGIGLSLLIYNEDSSNALLVRFIRAGDGDEAVDPDEELTPPADATWTEVQSIPAGETVVFDVRKARGVVLDRAAGSGAFTLRLLD